MNFKDSTSNTEIVAAFLMFYCRDLLQI